MRRAPDAKSQRTGNGGGDAVNAGGAIGKRSAMLLRFVAVATMVAGCSSRDSTAGSAPSSTSARPASSPSSEPAAPLVGRWEQSAGVHTCENWVRAMNKEGLLVAVEPSPPFVPGETWQQVAAESCVGKKGQAHSHFFDTYGAFGSLNASGRQVDDGKYRIVDAHTFQIDKSTIRFRYTVTGANTLVMDPVITKDDRREALAKPGEFTTASWMVGVALPGTSWHRVDCEGWC
jgi:hypothetical protein